MGLYVPNLARTTVDGKPVEAHVYEFTTQVSINREFEIESHKDGVVPTQVVFLFEENNAKKVHYI